LRKKVKISLRHH